MAANEKIEKLLKVPDLTEMDFNKWITKWIDENLPDKLGSWNRCEFSLADLAFRLRDEVIKQQGNAVILNQAMWLVYRRRHYNDHRFDSFDNICETEKVLAALDFAFYRSAIDSVISSLIAKELAKKK